MTTAHPSANPVSNTPMVNKADSRVWRYLDLPKVIWLLENKKLYLSRVDLLNDPLEGSLPRAVSEKWKHEQLDRFRKNFRENVYVSCWRMDDHESEAMWRLYCGDTGGVAIQTTYQQLEASTRGNKPPAKIAQLKYIDYEQGEFVAELLAPMHHKRIAFAHEKEVRVIMVKVDQIETSHISDDERKPKPYGVSIDWDPERFVENIYVNPYAQAWYFEVVKSVISKFAPAMGERIKWSQMRSVPRY